MQCEACGAEPARRYVSFHHNIGLILFRIQGSIQGDLCGPCIHKSFWTATLINLLFGWWGIISLFITPIFILGNLFYYVGLLGSASPNGRDRSSADRPLAAPSRAAASDENACYLCGKPLGPEERGSRICPACR